jgi:hypothetical protein
VISLWRREVLKDLRRLGESVWQFELQGTVRSRKYKNTFLSIKRHGDDDYYHGVRYVCTAINLGKWAWMAKDYAEKEGLQIDFSNLPSETWWDEFKRNNPVGVWFRVWLHRGKMLAVQPRLALQKAMFRLRGRRIEEPPHKVNADK